jgi:predicted ATPase
MIDELHVKAFKCLEDEKLEFRNLTVLAGTNSSGKSSVIQSLLQLALHSNQDYSSPLQKYLNFISNFDETINLNIDATEYILAIKGLGSEIEYHFNDQGAFTKDDYIGNILLEQISYSKGNLIFISADRVGPQTTYEINSNPLDKFGIYGEYAIGFLEKSKKKYVVIDELIRDSSRKNLNTQVNYWLEKILDTTIETEEIEGVNQVKASFKNGNFYVSPKNIGSGISYLISILIICLSSKKGQIIIIENPEIHIHPKAQSKLGEFLAFVASKGIQIVIETHNDHILNRFRYEVYKGRLKSDEIIIHYKEKDTPFEQIEITENGKFYDKNGENGFPGGFYDATLKEIYAINRGQ